MIFKKRKTDLLPSNRHFKKNLIRKFLFRNDLEHSGQKPMYTGKPVVIRWSMLLGISSTTTVPEKSDVKTRKTKQTYWMLDYYFLLKQKYITIQKYFPYLSVPYPYLRSRGNYHMQ